MSLGDELSTEEIMECYIRGYARGSADLLKSLVNLEVFTPQLAERWATEWTTALAEAAAESRIDVVATIEALSAFDPLMPVRRDQ